MTSPDARPRLTDHLQVTWLLVKAALSIVPYVIAFPVSWIIHPWMRRRFERRLATQAPRAPMDAPSFDPRAWSGKRVFLLIGEASGDRLMAPVVSELRRLAPDATICGYGAPACEAAGMQVDRDLTANAVMGVFAVIKSLGFWWGVIVDTLARWRAAPPDLVVGVDFPGLNRRLEALARKRGIRTVHLVAPQIWAHAWWRIGGWRAAADRILALLPFEPNWFERRGIDCAYVGHPLFEAPLPAPRSPAAFPDTGPYRVELLPGSRRREVQGNGPLLLAAAAHLDDVREGLVFEARLADERGRALFEAVLAEAASRPGEITVSVGASQVDAPLVAALACSGTVTAELGVALVPMAVCYRLARITIVGSYLLLTTPFFALVNLVAGRRVAPERLLSSVQGAEKLAADLAPVLRDPSAWAEARARLEPVRTALSGESTAARTAAWMLSP